MFHGFIQKIKLAQFFETRCIIVTEISKKNLKIIQIFILSGISHVTHSTPKTPPKRQSLREYAASVNHTYECSLLLFWVTCTASRNSLHTFAVRHANDHDVGDTTENVMVPGS